MLVVSEVSVVASASVLGLQTAAGVICRHLPGQALSFSQTFVRDITLVMTTLAAVSYTPLHPGCSAGTAAVRASGRPWTAVCGLHTLVHGGLWHGTRPPTGGAVYT